MLSRKIENIEPARIAILPTRRRTHAMPRDAKSKRFTFNRTKFQRISSFIKREYVQ